MGSTSQQASADGEVYAQWTTQPSLTDQHGGKPGICPAHFPVVQWVPHEVLPLTEGYVRVDSTKYRDWQVLAYNSAIDRDLLKKEQRLYAEWLSHQPAAVDRPDYETPTGIRHRPEAEDGAHQRGRSCAEQWERLERLQAETELLQHDQPSLVASQDESELEAESDESELSDSKPQANDWVCVSADPGAPSLGNGCPITTPDRGDRWDPGITESGDTSQPVVKGEADQKTPDLSLRKAKQRIAEVEGLLSEARALCKEAEVRSAAAANAEASPAEWGLLSIDDDLRDEDPAEHLRLRFLAALTDLVREEGYQITAVDDRGDTPSTEFGDEDNVTRRRSSWEHTPTRIQLDDFAHELAFLPDLTTAESTVLDYEGDNVRSLAHSTEQYNRLVKVLRRHAKIMISSGNALPPPAYGVVCDIDVQGHAPIKQRARRVPLKHLEKLYELLKGLLKAGLVAFSNSPWASPIVIVLKKNGVDIRLCIDYKMVNAITVALEYAMPLVDDLLTELESYLWFCSLDAASGFWAVMMTSRARRISAFVCALGHFEWLCMPFGLKNAPMFYQRLIDNALWGFVQPNGGWTAFAERMRSAESAMTAQRSQNSAMTERPGVVTKFEADYSALATSDPVQALVNGPDGDMFLSGEPDESSHVPVFGRRSFVDDICFGGVDFDDCLDTLDRLLTQFAECRISVSFTKSIFVQPKVDFLSHVVTPEGIAADPKKLAAIAEIPFPRNKKGMQAFLGALNYYSRFIQNLAVYGAVLYQLKEDDFGPSTDLSAAKASFAELKRKVVEAPILRHFDSVKDVHVMLFANEWALSSTLMQLHDDKLHPVRFCCRVLKDNEVNYQPAEKEVLALLQLLKVCYTLVVGKTIHVYTRFSTLEWVFNSKSLYGREVSFAVLLSPHHLIIKRVRERDADFAQLLQASITPSIGLDESLAHIAPPSKGSASVRMDPELLYARVPSDFVGHVLSFDGSAKTEKNGGYGSCSWIVWRLPTWDIEIAARAHLSSTTVNIAEYTGMNHGVAAALDRGITDLIIVGDSRLAIQQSMGVIACKKDTLQVELARHKALTKQLSSTRYLHVLRTYNASADALATEALETKAGRVILNA
ncbi:hypothetical protein PF004_g16572 [Phytophthora fragariae]|uniref:RNase H type-1 domain-containing protein n=1 Tax=Phytophthora fragariae TaxID=53985 RepID=A0A6G0NHY0_9STRA|nr:hypothetical protein PF004_g16572 [Phytophthora fragariae]